MTDTGFNVLMVKTTSDEVSCPRCTSQLMGKRQRLSQTQARSELAKVYRGWRCGCRRPPESHIVVHVQGRNLEYLKVCLGCASELTGIPKDELSPEVTKTLALAQSCK